MLMTTKMTVPNQDTPVQSCKPSTSTVKSAPLKTTLEVTAAERKWTTPLALVMAKTATRTTHRKKKRNKKMMKMKESSMTTQTTWETLS